MICLLGFRELFAQRACEDSAWRIVIRLDRKQDSRWTGDSETIPEYSGLTGLTLIESLGRDVISTSSGMAGFPHLFSSL
jgi:hypothetical protein